jgi:hypothetical protein
MPIEQKLRQQLWMTGTPILLRSLMGASIGQRVPWFGAVAGGILAPSLAFGFMIYVHVPSDWLGAFALFVGVMWLLLIAYVLWLWSQPPIVEFDQGKSSITIPRLRMSLPQTELARFDLLDGTCSDGEGGSYPVVALRLAPESFIFVTNRRREFRDAWNAFVSIVQASATCSPSAAA